MHTRITVLFVFLLAANILFAQKKALETITENDLKAHLEFIASDLMQGREFSTVTPGLDITADYLRTQCMKMGLKPGVENYIQSVPMEMVMPDAENSYFKVITSSGETTLDQNSYFSLFGPAKNESIEADIVFVGYNWYDDDTKYNDTEGLDIKGKVILAMTRNIEASTDPDNEGIDLNFEMMKISKAMLGGAKAL